MHRNLKVLSAIITFRQETMRKEKYVYNQQTLQFEKLRLTTREKLFRFAGMCCAIIFVSVGVFAMGYKYLPTPMEKSLDRELTQMEYHYSNLTSDFQDIAADVERLQQKDKDVHRMIFGMEPIDDAIWNGGIGGSKRYNHLEDFEKTGEMITESLSNVEKLKRKISIQSNSLDSLFMLAKSKEERLAAIPSIKPVREDKLKRKVKHLSGFGIRLHPVHKVKKFHKGIDFTAPKGTAIQSTGNGKVIRVEKRKSGYGNNVIIDHGYGFTSLYAHMKTVNVKKGQKVSKGQKIGTVGSTGTSTAPHLHYEVRINGKAVNPIDYCLDGLSPEEYKELIEKATVENQSFD